jgi:hypothetical protein
MRELPLADLFAKEKIARDITEARDIEKIRKCALDLLDLYYQQKKAANWAMEQTLTRPSTINIKDTLPDQPVMELAPKPVRPEMDVL